MEKKFYIIVNKKASSGSAYVTWLRLKKIFQREQIPFEIYYPRKKEDTIQWVRKLSSSKEKQEKKHIIIIGGDGTLNTVLQGIDDFSQIVLSCIPVGSGNDFAKGIGIEKNPERALEKILFHPEEEVIDYGVATVRGKEEEKRSYRFLISAGVGYDAEICKEVNHSALKNYLNQLHLGKLVYLLIGLKRVILKTPCRAKITLDGGAVKRTDGLFLSVAMNTPFEGGGVPFCPMADYKDGKFDVCTVKNMPIPKLLAAIVLVYQKKHYLFSEVKHSYCQTIEFRLEKERWIHIDGETPCKTRHILLECKQGLHIIK